MRQDTVARTRLACTATTWSHRVQQSFAEMAVGKWDVVML